MTKSCGDGVSRNATILCIALYTIVLGAHIFISRALRMKNNVARNRGYWQSPLWMNFL